MHSKAGPAFAPAPLVLALAALSGCGGGNTTLPACAQRTAIATAPKVHLPAGSVVYAREPREGTTLWHIVTPGSIESAVTALKKKLRSDGYVVTGGEVDEHDAEAEFSRGADTVRLRLTELQACAGAVDVQLAALHH